jgi:hypothetical protein
LTGADTYKPNCPSQNPKGSLSSSKREKIDTSAHNTKPNKGFEELLYLTKINLKNSGAA